MGGGFYELFHVIAHGGTPRGVDTGSVAQISDDVSDLPKGMR